MLGNPGGVEGRSQGRYDQATFVYAYELFKNISKEYPQAMEIAQ